MRKSQVRRTRRGGKMSIDITRQKGQGKEEETRAQGACEKEILTERKRRRTRSGRSQRERERDEGSGRECGENIVANFPATQFQE